MPLSNARLRQSDAQITNVHACRRRYLDLGKPALLGENIIPLPGLAAPHPQPDLQDPSPPACIKAAPSALPPPPAGGDPASVEQPTPTMIFSDLYKSPRATFKFRNPFPHGVPPPPSDIEADLVSKDKARQKEAVKKYLAEKVRNDWRFTWPPAPAERATPALEEPVQATESGVAEALSVPAAADEHVERESGEEADSESDASSVYSIVSEDPLHFRPRADWTSDLSDGDDFHAPASPFRFDSPEAVGTAVRETLETKRARRRRAVRNEATWNTGLACFEARRNAWTGAKTVRVKPKPQTPVSPPSPRRRFWRHHRTQSSQSNGATPTSEVPPTPTSPLQPTVTRTSTTTGSESDSGRSAGCVQRTTSQDSTPHVLYPVQTILPIPPPLLPPQNPMRSSIQPSMYGSLYDKVVVQSLHPACPVNLGDMLRACVVGWKRDGEWPPKPSYPSPAPTQTAPVGVTSLRQRKAQQQQQKRKDSTAANATVSTPGTGSAAKRLSLGGFFSASNHKPAAAPPLAAQEATAAGDKDKDKENHALGHTNSHSDEGAGSSGKALLRRSLHRVFSLGQHGHAHTGSNPNANANSAGGAPSQTANEVTAAG